MHIHHPSTQADNIKKQKNKNNNILVNLIFNYLYKTGVIDFEFFYLISKLNNFLKNKSGVFPNAILHKIFRENDSKICKRALCLLIAAASLKALLLTGLIFILNFK